MMEHQVTPPLYPPLPTPSVSFSLFDAQGHFLLSVLLEVDDVIMNCGAAGRNSPRIS